MMTTTNCISNLVLGMGQVMSMTINENVPPARKCSGVAISNSLLFCMPLCSHLSKLCKHLVPCVASNPRTALYRTCCILLGVQPVVLSDIHMNWALVLIVERPSVSSHQLEQEIPIVCRVSGSSRDQVFQLLMETGENVGPWP